jgi:hypothetical protein
MSNVNGIFHRTRLRAVRRWCGPSVLLGVAARPASLSSPRWRQSQYPISCSDLISEIQAYVFQ